jgi:hypothetical protein
LENFKNFKWPVNFQIGGYSTIDRNPYNPLKLPYNRSFVIQENGLTVFMGWPVSGHQLFALYF